MLSQGHSGSAGSAFQPAEDVAKQRAGRDGVRTLATGLQRESAPIGMVEEIDPDDTRLRWVELATGRDHFAAIAADRVDWPKRGGPQLREFGADRLEIAL